MGRDAAVTADEFADLVGGRLAHVTAARNLPSLARRGLLRPVTLARMAGLDEAALVLRRDAVALDLGDGVAVLNHQLPLRAGRRQDFLDGATVEEWSAQLDGRVFLWPGRARDRFAGSVAAREASVTLELDARAAFGALGANLDLAPINTGSALRRPARRGGWIYVPALAGAEAFRENRRRRGLSAGRDAVAEVSVRADIPADVLRGIALPGTARLLAEAA